MDNGEALLHSVLTAVQLSAFKEFEQFSLKSVVAPIALQAVVCHYFSFFVIHACTHTNTNKDTPKQYPITNQCGCIHLNFRHRVALNNE